ncbi:MAG TPA: T9SS type A sorting domain-containing protein [Niastella sp.]
MAFFATVQAQNISEIITDYNGFWKSGAGNINTVKPNNSHNVVAFSYNNKRYSTGVNDSLLTARNETFIAGKYKAMPVNRITGAVTSNTKCGLGEMYDGVHSGASATAPVNDLAKYMTDGIKGLDLGTCIANLPVGDLYFSITDLKAPMIGDTVPDILITQVADPSGSNFDGYEFLDVNGNRVGNKLDVDLSNMPVLGNWTADFYEANTNPMVLQSGFTNTDRPLRLWGADLKAWGIDSTNVGRIAYFKVRLNGNSDVAFVAFNENAFSFTTVLDLPVKEAKPAGNNAGTAQRTITLYPNPANSMLHVRNTSTLTGTYEIRNVHGAVLLKQKAGTAGVQDISIQNLPAGMYWLVFTNGTGQKAEGFIKN